MRIFTRRCTRKIHTKTSAIIEIAKRAIIVFMLGIVLTGCNRATNNKFSRETEYSYSIPSDEQQIEELQKMYNDVPEKSFKDKFESFNPWHLEHFQNEWGEDTEKAYIYTILSGNSWNIRIDYIPEDLQATSGVFRFSITDNEGHIQNMYGPVYIIVRDRSGENLSIPVLGVKGSIAFVEDSDAVDGLKALLDNEDFDIRMEFEKYNERHSTQARWESTPGSLQEAIYKL